MLSFQKLTKGTFIFVMCSPSDWTPEDVADQLRTVGLGKYARKFIEAGVTGPEFVAMTDLRLRDFGLPVKDRMTLVNYLKCLPGTGIAKRAAGATGMPARGSGGGGGRAGGMGSGRVAGGGMGSGRAAAAPRGSAAMPKQTAASKGRVAARAAEPRDPEPVAAVPKKPPVKRPGGLGRGGRQPDIPMEAADAGPDDRVECSYCGRKFASDRIAKHEDVCRTASKKRKVFNAKAQRIRGTEAAQFQKASREPAKPRQQMINGKPKYVVEHENLVASLKAARKYAAYADAAAAGKAKGPPPPMPQLQEVPDDRIQCKYCGRKFGQEQYERHVRHCAASAPIPSTRGRARGGATRGSTRGARGGRRF